MDELHFSHVPVLLDACLEGLNIRPDGIYVDGTAGGAGHSRAIAERLDGGRLIALDKDPDAVAAASSRLAPFGCATVVQSDFSELCTVLDKLGIEAVDGILLDLGVSSYQLDTPERGFSYAHDAPLDMRMTKTGLSARDVVNTYSFKDLCRVFRDYGEEKFAPAIAKNILKSRTQRPIATTAELAAIIGASIPARARREGGNPAKRVFQAIRIEVNGELSSLSVFLGEAFERLRIGGRMAIITFHSLEDRMVKQRFAALCRGCTCPPDFPVCICGNQPRGRLLSRKPIEAGERELAANSRSKSAKLRVIEKL
ncbi:16S rRNA (cytosine(1402)-N(4))-methyltransferase RsmH [Anaerotruncus colihominis]|mgnify:FL=1|uniref:16S rRNA (cytosine(1402)-N(4))-methyltransferase RsmH n=1 Tax=Anaerotruncus colihominis TaxID=169435 RepID=UPI00174BAF71|nr:16S rRNA (cytosine(1402)-N(4))-methyltransferase RsmH [Anaerotruncus colihominis]